MKTRLEEIRDSLDKYIKEELKKSPPDRDWEYSETEEIDEEEFEDETLNKCDWEDRYQ